MNFIIAIDGPSASGKGTLAKNIALKLNLAYLDTGALYRAVAFDYLQKNNNDIDLAQAIQSAVYIRDHFNLDMLNNPDLRNDTVASMTSKLSSLPEVRAILLELQHNFANSPPPPYRGSVLDGRDIGTIVCPEARLKLFITASTEIRAQRRTKELQNKGIPVTYDHVLQDMVERDVRDQTRTIAPTIAAPDAIIIDTSGQSADEVLAHALALAKDRGF